MTEAQELQDIIDEWTLKVRAIAKGQIDALPEIVRVPRKQFDRYNELCLIVPGANYLLLEVTKYPGSRVLRGVGFLPEEEAETVHG